MSRAPADPGEARRFVAAIYFASSLNPVNSSLIATALVPLADDLDVSVGQTSALVLAVYVASMLGQPTAGRLAETFGARRIMAAGCVLLIVGGVLGGLGNSLPVLVASRAVIGAGTSVGYPCAMLLIRQRAARQGLTGPPGRMLSGLQVSGWMTLALGLPLGGVLVDHFGWRATLLVNVPVGVTCLLMTLLWLPAYGPVEGHGPRMSLAKRVDVGGVALIGLAMVALIWLLLAMPRLNITALLVFGITAAVAIYWEYRAVAPIADVRLFRGNAALSRTYVRWSLSCLCLYSMLYGLTQWLQSSAGWSGRTAGLALTPMFAVAILCIGPISAKNLIRFPALLSAVASCAGAILLTTPWMGTSAAAVLLCASLFGVTLGASALSNQTALYIQVGANSIGTAAGLFRAVGNLGSIASSVLIGLAFHEGATDGALRAVALVLLGVAAATVLIVALDRQLPRAAGVPPNAS